MIFRKKHLLLFFTGIIFGIIYLLITLVNHYNFRTYALDLGLYTNALYKYAHFMAADTLMMHDEPGFLLGGHFDLYLVLFSPLVYIFGTYTLLIIQVAAILAGGIGIYYYFALAQKPPYPLLATIFFYAFFGIYSALSYDYHSTVVAASLVPWFFYFLKKRSFILASAFVLIILISQENIALWMLFICLGLMLEYRKERKILTYTGIYALFSLVYFVTVIYFIIPGFSSGGEYTGFTYSALGNTPWEAVKSLFQHPINSFETLFVNHNNSPNGDYVKMEMHILILLSGLYFLFLKPQYLLMLIPVYFQKLFHDKSLVWGIDGQYSIEFAPILAIGVFSVIAEFKTGKIKDVLVLLAMAGVLISTFRVMDNTVMYTQKSRIRFYQANHYKRNYNTSLVHKQLASIPSKAAVSAMSPFVPHLALREKIYQFPLLKDAEYIVFSDKENTYPMTKEEFEALRDKLQSSAEWEKIYNEDGLTILKRRVKTLN